MANITMEDVSKEQSAIAVAMSPTTTTTTSSENGLPVLPKRYRWRPTFWRIRPLVGVIALVVAILCLLVSLAILKGSDGAPIENWSFQPTVYLAIATAISNTAMHCALSQAAPIVWWYKALRGSSVTELELNWEAGQGFPRAFIKSFRYRRMLSLFSIASFATAFVLIDGPLLQRSSSVKRVTTVDNVPMNISLAPQLPEGFSLQIFSGFWGNTQAAIDVYEGHIHNKSIISNTHCNGTCQLAVRGPGYTSAGCRNQSWTINESMLRTPNSSWGSHLDQRAGAMGRQPVLFSVSTPTYFICDSGREPMLLSTGNMNYRNCQGNFRFANCTMMPAVLEYDITIQGNVITYVSPTGVAGPADNYCINASNPLAYTGFQNIMYPNIFSNGSLGHWHGFPANVHPVEVPELDTFSAFAWRYVELTASLDPCILTTYDPMDDIIAEFNDLLFRGGILAGSWTNVTQILPESPFPVHQSVLATRTREQNVFRSDIRWFLGAAAVQIITMLLILPAYYGWWNIGVELTLSPFNTAKAFDAPLLSKINSAAGSMGVVDEVGDMRLKLGAVAVPKVACSAVDDTVKQQHTNRYRVGLDTPDKVERPFKGARFTD